jgi:hypothetical protein
MPLLCTRGRKPLGVALTYLDGGLVIESWHPGPRARQTRSRLTQQSTLSGSKGSPPSSPTTTPSAPSQPPRTSLTRRVTSPRFDQSRGHARRPRHRTVRFSHLKVRATRAESALEFPVLTLGQRIGHGPVIGCAAIWRATAHTMPCATHEASPCRLAGPHLVCDGALAAGADVRRA